MATDIVPDLLDVIQKDFNTQFNASKKLARIRKLIDNGTATYEQANEYAVEVGEILAKVFKKHLNSEILPDGKMYYNIADRILNDTLANNHKIVAKVTTEIQDSLNKTAGLGIKGVETPLNQDRLNSLINRVAIETTYDDVAWILDEPVVNFTQSVVNDVVKANVDFHGKSGLSPTVTRTLQGHKPCDFCKNLAGTYKYPNVPNDVYKRHDRCRCVVEYNPGDSRSQNVWTREWS